MLKIIFKTDRIITKALDMLVFCIPKKKPMLSEEVINQKVFLRKNSDFAADNSYDAIKDAVEIIDQRILFY